MRFRHNWILAIALLAANAQTTRAQAAWSSIEKPADPQQPSMPGMPMPASADANQKAMQHDHDPMAMRPENFVQYLLSHTGSGTSAQPISTPAPMLMTMKGSWMLMFHANVFVLDEQQSS